MSDYRASFLTDFIQIYRANPCLWKIRSKEYFNKRAKREAYGKLLEKMKEIDHNATRETVVKKINSMRTTFRKEVKKVKERADNIGQYVPNLWYYDLLLFLHDQDDDTQEDVANWPLENNEQDVVQIHEVDEEYVPQNTYESHSPIKKKLKKSRSGVDKADAVLELVAQNLQLSQEGPLDIYGKYVASQLTELPNDMVLLSQKIINSVLFEARIGKLKNVSRIVHSDMDGSHASQHCQTCAEVISPDVFSTLGSIPNPEKISTEQDSRELDRTGKINILVHDTLETETPIDEERLIVKVEEYPVIYDTNYRNHRNISLIENVWKQIGLALNCSDQLCQNKWETLLGDFWKAHKLVLSSQTYRPKIKLWKWYKAMSYLLSSSADKSEVNIEMKIKSENSNSMGTQYSSFLQNSCQRENVTNCDHQHSLTLGNEDEAFFISLLPTVTQFDSDDKLDFRGDVLDMVRKIKRSRKSFHSANSYHRISNEHTSPALSHTRSELQNECQLVNDLNNRNFISVACKEEFNDPLIINV